MIAVLAASVFLQVTDLESLGRLALASLPNDRILRNSSMIDGTTFVTLTYRQVWYLPPKESELYPTKFLGNEYAYLDLWRFTAGTVDLIKSQQVGQMIPGWDRFPALFKRPAARAGAVFVCQPPCGDTPLAEVVQVLPKRPWFKEMYKGLGKVVSSQVTGNTVSVKLMRLKINRTEFSNISKRHTVTSLTLVAKF